MKFFLLIFTLSFSHSLFAEKAFSTHSFATLRSISGDQNLTSKEKRDFVVIRIPAVNASNKVVKAQYKFYIQAGLHGNEEIASHFVAWLANRILKKQSSLNILSERASVAFDFMPIVNPDGREMKSRYNANQVNLNRNFSHLWGVSKENPGTKPFSEEETRAIRYLLEKEKYTAAVDVHGYVNWVVGPSQPSQNTSQNIYAEKYKKWNHALRKITQEKLASYEYKTPDQLGDGGAFEDWAFWEMGIPAFCLELVSPLKGFPSAQPQLQNSFVELFKIYENYLLQTFQIAMELQNPENPTAVVP